MNMVRKRLYRICTHTRGALLYHTEPTWSHDVASKFYGLEIISLHTQTDSRIYFVNELALKCSKIGRKKGFLEMPKRKNEITMIHSNIPAIQKEELAEAGKNSTGTPPSKNIFKNNYSL